MGLLDEARKRLEEARRIALQAANDAATEGQRLYAEVKSRAEEQYEDEAELVTASQDPKTATPSSVPQANETMGQFQRRNRELAEFNRQHAPTAFDYEVQANYHGGFPGHPGIVDGGKLYVCDNCLVWLKAPLVFTLRYSDIYDLELDNFKVSMVRSMIGSADSDVHRHKNTVVVRCRVNGVKQRVRFEVWGGLSIHAGALNAQRVIDSLAEYRHLFIDESELVTGTKSAAGSLVTELERLASLYQNGALDDGEYRAFKAKLLQDR